MSIDLQICGACGAAQYPSRDTCRRCLCDKLEMRTMAVEGYVLAATSLCRSLEPDRLSGGPLRIGVVASDVGIRVIAALDADVEVGSAVRLVVSKGPAGPILAVPVSYFEQPELPHAGNTHEN